MLYNDVTSSEDRVNIMGAIYAINKKDLSKSVYLKIKLYNELIYTSLKLSIPIVMKCRAMM